MLNVLGKLYFVEEVMLLQKADVLKRWSFRKTGDVNVFDLHDHFPLKDTPPVAH